MNDNLKNKISELIDNQSTGTLATIRGNKPYSRYMIFFREDLTFYAATDRNTHKVEDINANPNVHMLIGDADKGHQAAYIEVEARATVEASEDLKQRFWNEDLQKWLSGPNDPNYILLKLEPQLIRYFSGAGNKPEELSLS